MAGYGAIRATCEAIIRLLEQSWDQGPVHNDEPPTFQVYNTRQFQERPVTTGVSLFLYNVSVNTVQRIPPGRPRLGSDPRPRQLPLDLYLLLTPWATEASLQHELLGWAMRVLEDNAVVSVTALNTPADTVFEPDETVEIISTSLSIEDLLRIWDGIPGDFQLSVPYTARIIRIDSTRPVSSGGPVLTRELEMGQVER
jgi:hypothetical protein